MKKSSLNLKSIPALVSSLVGRVARYRVIIFVVAIAAVYGYVFMQINSLGNAAPSDTSVSGELSTVRPPKVDKTVVAQLKALQDNSVNVQSLFDQARQNPFQE